ncbi:hypothetical protein ASPBRDRAFT_48449 [Aspergillus brasiliensis CBS 101740]|uniref:Protein kinase domain-containing protein n=1 Tax=Aspergillus brasiliensis (strain CBS 101740 / IMI 381727 / IBT 21946) TaxID=767769 RepID=A0A1L9U5G4_ASPBC|nr:hypothetical protein ASPBRDRAFT_48449 [Aspergillus brasiliensis CBS 101740]
MAVKDTLLSLDLSFEDCLYRFRRDSQTNTRVVYVTLKDLDIVPEESRTYGPDVIRELSKLREWYDETWETLTVYKDENGGGIRSERDLFPPHALQKQQIPGDYELVNIFDLQFLVLLNNRVFQVQRGERRCFLKIARFGYELGWLAQEIKTYHVLAQLDSALAPRILGYVFEETPHRVIGFILEEVNGYRPSASDFGICRIALQQLHDLDIVHGDIKKYNMVITDEGAKFIDLEDSCVGPAENKEDWDKRKNTEMQGLMEALLDKSGKGRPWTVDDDE